jgi:hypothetical protein
MRNKCKKHWNLGLVASVVKFKDGSDHVRVQCAECGKHPEYLKGALIENDMPRSETEREYRIRMGLPIGCRLCQKEVTLKIGTALCESCDSTDDGKAWKRALKQFETKVFDMNSDELTKVWELASKTI